MTVKITLLNRMRKFASVFIAVLPFLFFVFISRADAKSIFPFHPASLHKFIQQVKNGDAETIRGIYVHGVMAYAVEQQPDGDSKFVSEDPNVVTQFAMAEKAGSIGLLAHNTLAGSSFSNISYGNVIVLIYGNGATEFFIVDKISSYQALPYGQYRDLQTQKVIGVGELFDLTYKGDHQLILQTCIESDGDFSWGRLFIFAHPLKIAKNSTQ